MSTYTIRAGDTLSALAQRFHTTVGALARLNHISNVNLIYAGAKLKLPGHRTQDTFEPPPSTGPRPAGNLAGMNRAVGQRLAAASRQVAAEMPGTGWCAKGVSTAVSRVLGFYPGGNGNTIDDNLARSARFKEIHIPLSEALKIPGLVLSWNRTSSSLGSIYGHTAITWGDGHTTSSDYVESNTTNNGRSGLRIFMPV
jgi:hypothetical protein